MSSSITQAPRRLRKIRKNKQRQAAAQREPRKGQNPLVLAIVGLLLLAAWLGVSLFQIETTEA